MKRGKQPGDVEIAGGKTYYINRAGNYVPFDAQRYRAGRSGARFRPVDTREQVL